MIKFPNIHAYLLAGGKSSRMGTDKGLLHFQNKYLVEWVINELQFVFEKITIVANNAVYQKFNLEVIEDEIKNIGPAGAFLQL
ncbi:MAG: NTP transferase domain-containing protein [Chitinophagaceae bacterium]|nr:NTP transferase domain-containing protein [Chitinophagaceae bacterium]